MRTALLPAFPKTTADRDRWILERRGPREAVSADEPYSFLIEQELFASGEIGDVATVFLTNRECPWRCTMCDLWRHTLTAAVAVGEIPRQIEFALARLPPARQIKLYNSGSFFDLSAIPQEDYLPIAKLVNSFERVIVESHPALVGEKVLRFRDLLSGQLEVAMGLETAHPLVLEKLNKRMTLNQYASAAEWLFHNTIALRSFVLVQPPFLRPEEAFHWACCSLDFAQQCSATATTLLPTRSGNGAVDELQQTGDFTPPSLSLLEKALEYGLSHTRGRVFLDLWDIDRVRCCSVCRGARVLRLREMNFSATIPGGIACDACGGSGS